MGSHSKRVKDEAEIASPIRDGTRQMRAAELHC